MEQEDGMMYIGPTAEFRQAATEILGSDSPAAVIGAMRAEDQTAWQAVCERHAEILAAAGKATGGS